MPKRHKQKQKQATRVGFIRPPPFQANFRVKHRYRFQATSAGNSILITRRDLLNLNVVALTATTSARIFQSVKLNRVEMWAVAGSGTNDYGIASVALNWLSSFGPNTEVSNTGNAINTAHVSGSPPRSSLASFWSSGGSSESEVLFSLTFTVGTIVDVWVDAVLYDGGGAPSVTVAGATANFMYFLSLDRSSSNFLLPTSVSSA